MRVFASVGILVFMVGCSGVEAKKGPSVDNFIAPMTFDEAYRRLQAYSRQCLSEFETSGGLLMHSYSGVLQVSDPTRRDTGEASLKAYVSGRYENTSDVVISVDGVGVFDQKQLQALRRSVESGTPSCR